MTFFLKYGNITVDPFPDQKLLTTQNSSGRPFSVSSFFASHPITVLLEIFRGTDAWAEFGGDRPANTPKSPPMSLGHLPDRINCVPCNYVLWTGSHWNLFVAWTQFESFVTECKFSQTFLLLYILCKLEHLWKIMWNTLLWQMIFLFIIIIYNLVYLNHLIWSALFKNIYEIIYRIISQ